jgi:hypothetical protein
MTLRFLYFLQSRVFTTSHSLVSYFVTYFTNFYHQLDAQTSCLFTYNTLIKIIYMFRAYPAHLQEVHGVIVHMQPLVSSLSADDCLVHRCCNMFSFGYFPGVWVLIADVSEHSIASIFICWSMKYDKDLDVWHIYTGPGSGRPVAEPVGRWVTGWGWKVEQHVLEGVIYKA